MSNILDPDKARQNVGPDMGPICLQRLRSDDTSRYWVNFGISLSYSPECYLLETLIKLLYFIHDAAYFLIH